MTKSGFPGYPDEVTTVIIIAEVTATLDQMSDLGTMTLVCANGRIRLDDDDGTLNITELTDGARVIHM